eukprot:GILI01065221.1.p1 GENE.GILI01065221.1~~GILI01065221.1.p1  ORF type:complete len:196 (-),score=11.76 GILI01065221.1:254-802(-)
MFQAVALLIIAISAHAYTVDPTPVGAVLEYPSGCRGDQFESVQKFIAEYKPLYEAVSVTQKDRLGKAHLQLFNIHEQLIDQVDVADMRAEEMVDWLSAKGIQFWSPKPEYDRQIIPTSVCLAWRQTAGCDVDGAREPQHDEHCTTLLARDRSGFCECVDGRRITLLCKRPSFVSCESQCEAK